MNRYRSYTCFLVVLSLTVTGCIPSPRFTFSRKGSMTGTGSYSMLEEGVASYYADEFNGRPTSNGEQYDMNKMTAAHRTLPFNTMVRVTNSVTRKSVVVRINDRGPFKDNRIIDLSLAAAKELEMIGPGTVPVQLEVVALGDSTQRR